MLIEPKTCAFCGRLFFSLDRKRIYCGEACYAEAARNQNTRQRQKKPPTPRQCPFCGKVFLASGKRKFCSSACLKNWHRLSWQRRCADAKAVIANASREELNMGRSKDGKD